jgi:antitoxin (DNA-binding transcriptional repressor) of toxin-antitoxin stability system
MKQAKISELRDHLTHYLELIAEGETVQVMDGSSAVAELRRTARAPVSRAESEVSPTELDHKLAELAARGAIRRGSGELPPDFFTTARPQLPPGVGSFDAIREDRNDR